MNLNFQNTPSKQPPNILGISAKSVHAHHGVETNFVAASQKARRFRMLESAQKLLYDPKESWINQPRTVGCMRNMRTPFVQIYRKADGSGARYAGLATCNSIWACPICAEKIANTRRDEIARARAKHQANGGETYLITLTFPHKFQAMPLPEMLAKQTKALQGWKNSRTYKRVMEKWGRIGNIKALEITYGEHGWHPHTHEVLFANAGMQDAIADIGELKDTWIRQVIKVGLADNNQVNDMLLHSFDFKAGEFVAEYVAKFGREPEPTSRELNTIKDKWGLQSEVTMFTRKDGHTKKGEYMGLTPFGLLADFAENKDGSSAALYVEYVRAIEGKRQLTWTPGLKKQFDIDEIEDDDIDDPGQQVEEESLGLLSKDDWWLILKHEKSGSRFDLLWIAAESGRIGIDAYLDQLRQCQPTNRGSFYVMQNRSFQ